MTDIHSHILPHIDDGAKSAEEAVQLLKMLKKQGVDRVIATPHYYAELMSVDEFLQKREQSYALLQKELQSVPAQDVPEVALGCEIMLSENLSEVESLNKLTMPDGKHLLIELPEYTWGDWIYHELFKVSALHLVTPIIAHIDRYLLEHTKEDIERLIDLNFPVQFNVQVLESRKIFREFMKYYKSASENFMYIGSDCHSMENRPPEFDKYYQKLCRKLGKAHMDYMEEQSLQLLQP